METPLVTYKRILMAQPPLEGMDLSQLLGRGKSGDEAALRQIAASCLEPCLQVVEAAFPGVTEDREMELLQEANAAMMGVIANFQGPTAAALVEDIAKAVLQHLHQVNSGG